MSNKNLVNYIRLKEILRYMWEQVKGKFNITLTDVNHNKDTNVLTFTKGDNTRQEVKLKDFISHWGDLKHVVGYKYENILDYDNKETGKWYLEDGSENINPNWSIYTLDVSEGEEYTILRKYPDSGRYVFFDAQDTVVQVLDVPANNVINGWHRNFVTVPNNPTIVKMGFCFQHYTYTLNTKDRIMLLKESNITEELEIIPYLPDIEVIIDSSKVSLTFNPDDTNLSAMTITEAIKELDEVKADKAGTYENKKILIFGDLYADSTELKNYIQSYFGGTVESVTFRDYPVSQINVNQNKALCSQTVLTSLNNKITNDSFDVVVVLSAGNEIDYDGAINYPSSDGHKLMQLTDPLQEYRTDTITGALATIISEIKIANPTVQLMLCTLPNIKYGNQSTDNFTDEYSNINGITVAQINNSIRDTAKKYSVPCVDLGGLSGISKFNRNTYLATHDTFNSEGNKLLANTIVGEMLRYDNRL